MSRQSTASVLSFVLGGVALLMGEVHGLTVRVFARSAGQLLHFVDRLGLIGVSEADPAFSALRLGALDDDRLAWMVLAYAVYAALLAVVYAAWSLWQDEAPLYPAAGFLCAACALYKLHANAGLALVAAGGVMLWLLRRQAMRRLAWAN